MEPEVMLEHSLSVSLISKVEKSTTMSSDTETTGLGK